MERDSEKIQVSSLKQDVALETIPTEESENSSSSIWNFIQRLSKKLDSLGVETRGIERIEPYERSTNKVKQLISVIGLWLSACGGLSSMSTFLLGPLILN